MQKAYSRKIILGLQHTVAMFGSTILVPLLTGLNPAVALFTAGVGTLIFHALTRWKVPVFLGSSFAFIAPILAAESAGFAPTAVGSGIVGAGLIYILFAGLVVLLGVERIKSLFPPIVTGAVIVVIGLTLAPVATKMVQQQWGIAAITFCAAVIAAVFLHGLFKMIPVLIGIVVGYACAIIRGGIDFSAVHAAALFGLPHFTHAPINWVVVLLITPVALVSIMEHIGDVLTNGRVVGQDFFKDPGLQRTLLGDGVATLFAGLVGGPTLTTYAENTGVLAMTKVYDPSIIRIGAGFAILFGLSPKLAALLHTLPIGVLGGISMLLFGMIATIGIRTLAEATIDFTHSRNLIVISAILVLGLGGAVLKFPPLQVGATVVPLQLAGMALAAVVGILLNLLLPAAIELENE